MPEAHRSSSLTMLPILLLVNALHSPLAASNEKPTKGSAQHHTSTTAPNRGGGPTPIAHYPFDDDALDISGNAFHGTLQGGAGFTDQAVFGSALDLIDVNGWVDLPPILDESPSCTLSLWLRVDGFGFSSFSLVNYIFDEQSFGRRAPDLYLDQDFELFSGDEFDSLGPLPTPLPSGWHHVVAVFEEPDTGQIRYYLNGVELGTRPRSSNTCGQGAVSTVGAFAPGDPTFENYYSGQIDDLRIYSEALSPAEVEEILQEAQLASSGRVDLQIPPGIDPSVPNANNFELRVSGQDHIFEFWPYVRFDGDGSETRFPAPDQIDSIFSASFGSRLLQLLWDRGTLHPDLTATLTLVPAECASIPCTNGPDGAGMAAQLNWVNEGASPVDLEVFLYADVDLNGAGANHRAEARPPTIPSEDFVIEVISGDAMNIALAGVSEAGTVTFDVAPYRSLGNDLDDASVTNLAGSGLPFGPADFTMGTQTAVSVNSGGTAATIFSAATNWAFFFDGFEEGDTSEWSTVVP